MVDWPDSYVKCQVLHCIAYWKFEVKMMHHQSNHMTSSLNSKLKYNPTATHNKWPTILLMQWLPISFRKRQTNVHNHHLTHLGQSSAAAPDKYTSEFRENKTATTETSSKNTKCFFLSSLLCCDSVTLNRKSDGRIDRFVDGRVKVAVQWEE